MNVKKLQYLVGYTAHRNDTRTCVVNEPLYADTPPPVALSEEYLGELAMQLWYLFVVEHKLRLRLITVKVLTDSELAITLTDGSHNDVYLRINRGALSITETLTNMWQGITSAVHTTFDRILNEIAIPPSFEATYEAWRREQFSGGK